jgi:hypothetical protein
MGIKSRALRSAMPNELARDGPRHGGGVGQGRRPSAAIGLTALAAAPRG